MKKNDYQYALKPDWQSDVIFTKNTASPRNIVTLSLTNDRNFNALNFDHYTWLLAFSYQSTHKKKLGFISILRDNKEQNMPEQSQYFEAGEQGNRYLNLSGLLTKETTLSQLQLMFTDCQSHPNAKLLGFKKPDIHHGPILIIAPHADDAELAAYGVYSDFSDQVWITTINAGQRVQSLDRQYIHGLDLNLNDAIHRKAQIRAWNSMTTPLLAGVKFEQLSSLGYFNLTLEALYKTPKKQQVNEDLPELTPKISRSLNRITLPNDEQDICSGQSLIDDLTSLLEQIKPTSVFITDPEIDPHPEHIMSAHALALAIQQSHHTPDQIFMYVNHLRTIKTFPYGPEHARTALPPWHKATSVFGQLSCYSHQLSLKTQKEKVVSFDTMHDLRSKSRIQKTLKRWWSKKITKSHYQFYGLHAYFQTHIKANEVFTVVDGHTFSNALTQTKTAIVTHE